MCSRCLSSCERLQIDQVHCKSAELILRELEVGVLKSSAEWRLIS